VKPDVENVFGGKASDVLTGSAGPNDLFGFAAGDTINGATGADRIAGDGSAGFLGVVDGDNKLTGGQGADLIAGAQGDDRIEVQDGVADQVFCLGGSDTGDADSIDTLASDCGGITVHPLAPTFSVSPATKNFGSRAIAAGPTAAQTFTVTNRGTAGLHISDVKVTGTAATQFKKTSDACRTQTVAPGKTCAVKLTFDPSTKGQKAAQLSFTDGASGSPHKVTLQGRGT
jgi:Ca2+-binding RTX toxin-like protein